MFANMKNVTINEYNEEMVIFAQSIDFSELFKHVKTFTKVDCDFHQPEISTTPRDVYISFASHDITSQTGAFASILEHCYFCGFNGSVFKDKETKELGYWVTVGIQYKHKGIGSNGMDVVSAWYRASTGWVYRNAGE